MRSRAHDIHKFSDEQPATCKDKYLPLFVKFYDLFVKKRFEYAAFRVTFRFVADILRPMKDKIHGLILKRSDGDCPCGETNCCRTRFGSTGSKRIWHMIFLTCQKYIEGIKRRTTNVIKSRSLI